MAEWNELSRRGVLGGAALLVGGAGIGWGAPRVQGEAAPEKPAAPAGAKPRTVFLVRHAEKAAENPRDPSLSEVGKLRAAALLRLLGDTRLTHVWTSEYKRTQETAAGLAAKHGVETVPFPGRDPLGLAERIKAMPEGSTALVVGHSNTLPAIAKALGASLSNLAGGTDLGDNEYDRLVVIALLAPESPCALVELRYGAENPH